MKKASNPSASEINRGLRVPTDILEFGLVSALQAGVFNKPGTIYRETAKNKHSSATLFIRNRASHFKYPS